MENNREEAPGAKLLTYEHQGGCVNAVSWSPDGLFVASGRADATLRIWDAATAQTQLILRAHSDIVKAVAWSPDGHRLASASRDGTVLVWESASGELLLKYDKRVAAVPQTGHGELDCVESRDTCNTPS